jgi:hypothetical protein
MVGGRHDGDRTGVFRVTQPQEAVRVFLGKFGVGHSVCSLWVFTRLVLGGRRIISPSSLSEYEFLFHACARMWVPSLASFLAMAALATFALARHGAGSERFAILDRPERNDSVPCNGGSAPQ